MRLALLLRAWRGERTLAGGELRRATGQAASPGCIRLEPCGASARRGDDDAPGEGAERDQAAAAATQGS